MTDRRRYLYYVVLWHLRGTDPNDTAFHWGLNDHHQTGSAFGYKCHIRNLSANWLTGHGATNGIRKSMALVIIVRIIRNIPANYVAQLEQLVRADDASHNSLLSVSCTVWLFRVLQRLQYAGLLKCNDLGGLEREFWQISQEHRASACIAKRPPPICVSALCT